MGSNTNRAIDRAAGMTWMQLAACQNTNAEMFFDDTAVREAQLVCSGCPVQSACLEYAMSSSDIMGVWGGLSARGRSNLRRRTRRQRQKQREAEQAAHAVEAVRAPDRTTTGPTIPEQSNPLTA